jgi:Raf kinase inhibitor-like YbhB/YbcL family protein
MTYRRTMKPMKWWQKIAWGLLLALVLTITWLATAATFDRQWDRLYHVGRKNSIALKSNSVDAAAHLPIQCTCKGTSVKDALPELHWTNLPKGTSSLAIIVMDYDVPSPAARLFSLNHWVAYNISPNITTIPEGATTADLIQKGINVGKNSMGESGFVGACPPFGQHQYFFRIYALDLPRFDFADGDRVKVMEAMRGHILGFGEMVATFPQ